MICPRRTMISPALYSSKMGSTSSRAAWRADSVNSALYRLLGTTNPVTISTTSAAWSSFNEKLTSEGRLRTTVSTSCSRMLRRETSSSTSSDSCWINSQRGVESRRIFSMVPGCNTISPIEAICASFWSRVAVTSSRTRVIFFKAAPSRSFWRRAIVGSGEA